MMGSEKPAKAMTRYKKRSFGGLSVLPCSFPPELLSWPVEADDVSVCRSVVREAVVISVFASSVLSLSDPVQTVWSIRVGMVLTDAWTVV